MASKKGSTAVRTEENSSYFQAGYVKRSQYVSFTSSSAKSGLLDDETSLVEVFPTQDCWISIIANADSQNSKPSQSAVAVANIRFCPGGMVNFIGVPPGVTSPVVAVIRDSTDGTLHVTEYD